jgi:hypothetical protein
MHSPVNAVGRSLRRALKFARLFLGLVCCSTVRCLVVLLLAGLFLRQWVQSLAIAPRQFNHLDVDTVELKRQNIESNKRSNNAASTFSFLQYNHSSSEKESAANETFVFMQSIKSPNNNVIMKGEEVALSRNNHQPTNSSKSLLGDIFDKSIKDGSKVMFPAEVSHFYTTRRIDRMGSALMAALLAHAFSFYFHRTFGGLCGPDPIGEPFLSRTKKQATMLKWLGLQNEISISGKCPSKTNTSAIVLSEAQFYSTGGGAKLWTPDWINYIKQRMLSKPRTKSSDNGTSPTLVVHIRRGDVVPCNNYTKDRYLPNSHYVALIKKYQTKKHRVIVHSERESYENWTDFEGFDRLQLKLNSTLEEAWQDMLEADIFIMSISSFSIIPAVLTSATTIVRPDGTWIPRLPHWVTVDRSLSKASKAKMMKLREGCTKLFDSMLYHRQVIGPE